MGNKNRRQFNDKSLKLPYSLGELCEKMYQQTWFDNTPIVHVWNDVEITMKKIQTSP